MPVPLLAGARVLVTGANGFIGARLTRRLLREGAAVHAMVSPASRAENLADLANAIVLERVDVLDRTAMAMTLRSIAPRAVFHLVSHGNHARHYESPDALFRLAEINLIGTLNLLAACRDAGVACIVNTGSAFAEYGAGVAPMDEAQRLAPSTYYGATKAGATLLAGAFAATTGLHVITLRPLYVYGPGDWDFRFIPTVIACALRGEVLRVTSLQEKKNFVFVDDVVEAYVAAANTPPGGAPIVNIGSPDASTLGDVVRLVEQCLGRPVQCAEGAYDQLQWPGECWAAEITLAEHLLGWRPRTSLEDGIHCTVEWMLQRDAAMRNAAR